MYIRRPVMQMRKNTRPSRKVAARAFWKGILEPTLQAGREKGSSGVSRAHWQQLAHLLALRVDCSILILGDSRGDKLLLHDPACCVVLPGE
jgi:hypothetical protein